MSLDVYLYGESVSEEHMCECGHNHFNELFTANITHNLGAMAKEAGLYEAVWRPEEIGLSKGSEVAAFLRGGISRMEQDPPRFIALDSANGWGTYRDFLPWLKAYLKACEEYPDADVKVSR